MKPTPDQLLAAHWQTAMHESIESAALQDVAMPRLSISGELRGTTLTFRAATGSVSGDLSSLALVCEKALWLEGWSHLRTSKVTEYTLRDIVGETYRRAVPLLLPLLGNAEDRGSAIVVAILADADPQNPAVRQRLAACNHSLERTLFADSPGDFIAKTFAGKKKMARLAMLKAYTAMLPEPRPLQRRKIVCAAAEAIAGEAYGNAISFEAAARPFWALCHDEEPCVQEVAHLLLEALGEFLIDRQCYAEALPAVDHGVEHGPSFIQQHLRRFLCLLSVGEPEKAEADFARASAAAAKLAELSASAAQILRSLAYTRVDALFQAAIACDWQRQGLHPSEDVRTKKKKLAQPAPETVRHFTALMRQFAEQARAELSAFVPETERQNAALSPFVFSPRCKLLNAYDLRPAFERLTAMAGA